MRGECVQRAYGHMVTNMVILYEILNTNFETSIRFVVLQPQFPLIPWKTQLVGSFFISDHICIHIRSKAWIMWFWFESDKQGRRERETLILQAFCNFDLNAISIFSMEEHEWILQFVVLMLGLTNSLPFVIITSLQKIVTRFNNFSHPSKRCVRKKFWLFSYDLTFLCTGNCTTLIMFSV